MKKDIVILGGGIAGLTTALALKKIGMEATIVEAAPVFKPVGAGITLAANAMQVYCLLGIYDKLLTEGNSLGELKVLAQKGKKISQANADRLKNGFTNLAISRHTLHNILLNEIDQKNIISGKKSIRMVQEEEKVKVWFDDQSFMTCDALIVAEGIHSTIRKQLLPSSTIRYSGYTCWRGLTTNTNLNIQETSETWGKNGRFGIVPIGDNQIYWFACKNASSQNQEMKAWKQKELLQNFQDYHEDIKDVLKNTPDNHIIWNDIIDLKPISTYAFGSVLLIGDAAHATTPNMGQGACQAIEDAFFLAHELQRNQSIQTAFIQFEQKRLRRTQTIVNQSERLGKIAQLENPILAWVRNTLLRLTPSRVLEKQLAQIYTIDLKPLKEQS
jgi:2-polyprenyl-6-methoxyphenol hydroxylase-like FAD-dependent oxidoreductase